MSNDTINECLALSHSGKITFPEVMMKLASCGIERYLVDLVGLQNFYYDSHGKIYARKVAFEGSAIAKKFDADAVKSAIVDIQHNRIDYPKFLHRIMAAGCCHYEVFILGKMVIYFGRDGSMHIEKFPMKP